MSQWVFFWKIYYLFCVHWLFSLQIHLCKVVRSLELELQTVANCYKGAGNWGVTYRNIDEVIYRIRDDSKSAALPNPHTAWVTAYYTTCRHSNRLESIPPRRPSWFKLCPGSSGSFASFRFSVDYHNFQVAWLDCFFFFFFSSKLGFSESHLLQLGSSASDSTVFTAYSGERKGSVNLVSYFLKLL